MSWTQSPTAAAGPRPRPPGARPRAGRDLPHPAPVAGATTTAPRTAAQARRRSGGLALGLTLAAALGCAAPPPAPHAAGIATTIAPPWWAGLRAGIYRWRGRRLVIAAGHDRDRRHLAARLLEARVRAEAALAGRARLEAWGRPPLDVVLGRDGQLWVLLGEAPTAPDGKGRPDGAPPELRPPPAWVRDGAYLIDGHRLVDGYHDYQACPIEGPLLNPNWGFGEAWAARDWGHGRELVLGGRR